MISAWSAITGPVVSPTCTLKVSGVAAFPLESLALQETAVSPSGKVAPEAGEQITTTGPSTASVAVGFVYVTVAPVDDVASAFTSACAAITGPVVSPTLTWNEPVAVLSAWSVEEQLTVVEPIGKVEPDEGAQLMVTLLSRLSATEAEYVTVAPALDAASAVMSDGKLKEGAV